MSKGGKEQARGEKKVRLSGEALTCSGEWESGALVVGGSWVLYACTRSLEPAIGTNPSPKQVQTQLGQLELNQLVPTKSDFESQRPSFGRPTPLTPTQPRQLTIFSTKHNDVVKLPLSNRMVSFSNFLFSCRDRITFQITLLRPRCTRKHQITCRPHLVDPL